MDRFKNNELDKKYEFNSFLKSSYLQADFNGDLNQDIAVFVVEKATKKKGVLIFHGKSNNYFILGAGKEFGNGSDNFNWADKWKVYKKKIANETQFDKKTGDIIGSKEIKLVRPAILIEDIEDGATIAGGIIYWNNKEYTWIHQGE